VSPIALCKNISQQPRIKVLSHQHAITLKKTSTGWQILNQHNEALITADSVVIANSHDATQFEQCQHLPLKPIRGQITELAETAFRQSPRTVICHDGYITPAIDHRIRFGATFDMGDSDKQLRSQDHHRNLASLSQSLPGILLKSAEQLTAQDLSGRANVRCTSPDYLPLIGAVPVYQHFLNDYAALSKDANKAIDQPGRYHPVLYLNIAHGSRGLTSTPLCSELLASLICNEPRPLPQQLVIALNPARFIIRDIIRGKINLAC